jgi:GNAT superfamily N-acetyltransferase
VFRSLTLAAERQRFDWEFLRNPARDTGLPLAHLMKEDGKIVAGFSFVPYRVQIGDEVVAGAAGIDLFVAESHRGRGLSRSVVEPFWREGFCAFPFSTGLNAASDHLFRACGGVLLGGRSELTAYAYFVDGAHPADPSAPRDDVEIVHDVPADHDRLWQRVRRAHRVMVVRDAAYLRWRYVDFPFERPVLLRAQRQGSTTGLAIVQRDERHDRLYLLELLTEAGDDRALRGLLRAATEHADASGLKTLYYSTRARDQVGALHGAGFADAPGDVPTYIARIHRRPASGLISVRDWYVSLGDGDMLFDVGGPRAADEARA